MGVFTRFKDIINSNISSMLDKAEDPEKMIKLMIREMEDTLIEIKVACAGVMAAQKKIERRLDEAENQEALWEKRAILAVEKGKDDLAREALSEKRHFVRLSESLENDRVGHGSIIEQYQEDIRQLEDKLNKAREKKRMLVQRHIRAKRKIEAQEEIRRMDGFETLAKFDELENRIERMEVDAELVNYGRKPTLDEAFDKLAVDDDIEKELEAIKSSTIEKTDKTSSVSAS